MMHTGVPERPRRWTPWLALSVTLALSACQSTTTQSGAEGAGGALGSPGPEQPGAGGAGQVPEASGPPVTELPPLEGEALVPESGTLVLRDQETGTLWNLRGEAFSGPLAEEKARLTQVPGFVAFWFAWSVFNHDTEIWTSEGTVLQVTVPPIEGEGGCDVPCAEIIGGGPPKDGIPSLDFDGAIGELELVAADDPGAAYLQDDDLVLGVVVAGEDGAVHPRAYSHNVLWWHEIVNDEVDGRRFTVSFCPLTGSGLVFDGGARGRSFGTSGRLFNSNLVMYDRLNDSFWSQMMTRSITGPDQGSPLAPLPVVQTTWAQWQAMWPDTLVTTTDTGHQRDYARYPYVRGGRDYRTNHDDTFLPTRPEYDRRYGAKVRTLGLRIEGQARGYPFEELLKAGSRAVVNDTLGEAPIAVIYDEAADLVLPFERRVGDQVLTFEVTEAP